MYKQIAARFAFTQKIKWIALYIAVGAIGYILDLPLLPLLASGVFMALILPLKDMGLFGRLSIVFTAYLSLNMVLALIFWLINQPLSLNFVSVSYFLIALILFVGAKNTQLSKSLKSLFPLDEVLGLIVTVVAGMVLLAPAYLSTTDQPLLRTAVGTGVDNLAHLNFIEHVRKQGGYIYGSRGINLSINAQLGKGANNYPQGYHVNAWLIGEGIQGKEKSDQISYRLQNYVLISAGVFALLFFTFTQSVTTIARKAIGVKTKRRILAAIIGAIYVLFGTLLYLYSDGFQPQLLGMALLLQMGLLLFLFQRATKASMKILYVFLSLIHLIGVGFVYFYLLPVGFIALLIIVLEEARLKRFKLTGGRMIMLGGLAVLSGAQAVLYTYFERIGSQKINDPGGALILDTFFIVGIIAISIAYALFRKRSITPFNPFAVMIGISGIFAGALFVFQYATVGELNYYYYKSLHTIILLCGVLLAVALADMLQMVRSRAAILLTGSALMLLSVSPSLTRALDQHLKGYLYSFDPVLANQAIKMLHDEEYRYKTTQIIAIGNTCRTGSDLYFNRSLMTLSGEASTLQSEISTLVSPEQDIRQKAVSLIGEYQKEIPDNRLIIVSPDPAIQDKIRAVSGNKAGLIEFIDPYKKIKGYDTGCPKS